MKKVLFFLIVILSVSSSFTMNSIAHDAHSVAFLHNKLAIGTTRGFGFMKSQNVSSIKLSNNLPALDIITNPNKEKVAFLCKNFCYIYDVKTEQQLDRFYIPDGDSNPCKINYTAAFSSVDDTFFICHNDQLMFDGKSITLPFTGRTNFSIACHPTKKQILYPNSYQSLLIKNFDGSPSIQYTLDTQIAPETIMFATFNPCNPNDPRIALVTKEKDIFFYDPTKENNTLELLFTNPCHTLAFIPHSSFIGAVCDNALYYFDYDYEQLYIATIQMFNLHHMYSDRFTRTFDFSPNGTQYTIILSNKLFICNTPLEIIKNLYFFMYCGLKKYCLESDIPLDICRVCIKKLLLHSFDNDIKI